MQECILVLVADRMACIPIAPAENAVGKIAAGLAMTAVGVVEIPLGSKKIDVSQLATAEHLAAAIDGSGGFYVGADWTYRTRIPVIGTMLMHGDQTITTRERVPAEMFAKLTLSRAPMSSKAVKVVVGIGTAIVAAAVITYLATGSLEVLFGIGFWGILLIATSLYAWLRLRRTS
ncbi:MAG TPA: hypothetical protein VLB44_21270 [Kofleriaceae bacterium]|nr:hypothetical protein [Kofleriaceae bacterium]